MRARLAEEHVGAVLVFLHDREVVPGPRGEQRPERRRREDDSHDPLQRGRREPGRRVDGEQRVGEEQDPEARRRRDPGDGVALRREVAAGPAERERQRGDRGEACGEPNRHGRAHQRHDARDGEDRVEAEGGGLRQRLGHAPGVAQHDPIGAERGVGERERARCDHDRDENAELVEPRTRLCPCGRPRAMVRCRRHGALLRRRRDSVSSGSPRAPGSRARPRSRARRRPGRGR